MTEPTLPTLADELDRLDVAKLPPDFAGFAGLRGRAGAINERHGRTGVPRSIQSPQPSPVAFGSMDPLTGISEGPGQSSGSLIGMRPIDFFGESNFLMDPTLELVYETVETALTAASIPIGRDWNGQYILNSGTLPTTIAYQGFDRIATGNGLNSGTLQYHIITGAAACNVDILLTPTSSPIAAGASANYALPYLVATCKFRNQQPAVLGTDVVTFKLEILNVTDVTTPAVSSTISLASLGATDTKQLLAFLAQTAAFFGARAWSWRLRINIAHPAGVGRDYRLYVGEPSLHYAYMPAGLPYMPVLARWHESWLRGIQSTITELVGSPGSFAGWWQVASVAGVGESAMAYYLGGDSQPRAIIGYATTALSNRSGLALGLGSGANLSDVRLTRSAAGVMTFDGNALANPTQVIIESTAGQRSRLDIRVAADTTPRTSLFGDATSAGFQFSPGNTGADTEFLRISAGVGRFSSAGSSVASEFRVEATSGQTGRLGVRVAGDTDLRAQLRGDATVTGLQFGVGSAVADWTLNRSGTNAAAVGTGHILDLNVGKLRTPIGTAALQANEGYTQWQTTRKLALLYDGAREKAISEIGWLPYSYAQNQNGTELATAVTTLAANGGAIQIPFFLESSMLLQSVTLRNTDVATLRSAEWRLYEDRANTTATLDEVATANGTWSFTPGAASNQTSTPAAAPIYLGPGLYWLVIRNTGGATTFGLGGQAAGTMALNITATKTLAGALAATLDMVTTWTKAAGLLAVRLNGRVMGQTTAY